MLNEYERMDVQKTGHVTIEQFADYLHLPVSDAVQEVFHLYDRVSIWSLY